MISKILRFLFTKKCIFCSERDSKENLEVDTWFPMFYSSSYNWYYHKNCIKHVIFHPELYSEEEIDKAILIKKRELLDKEIEENRIKRRENDLAYLRKNI
jgi:hypothetical protein